MLLTIYSLNMLLATMLMAVHCWIPALFLVGVGVGISLWCLIQGHRRWDGVERRRQERRGALG